ncbi:hypothetical protein CPT03_21915 [Pedobacter ginsengisoli]|uniref:DoxX family protein n=1 Tax=Pedobacter ginsengisoli TaxID=363852 RepID=A0A2D1UBP2_9SPHI|nr:hypothetical protein [Pedobacter ginsengisoli]ATP58934.1 hypothetical protein CPT03_21915 [Pedobacter ginsengisoli]
MKQVLAFLTQKHLYLGMTRYLLGITMIPYALTKILRTQFVLTGFALTELQSLESMSGTTLAWAFLGHSVWFQVLLGFLELIPAILLLFRRTTLLGAMLMLPVTLNVFLINYALDLWPGTKVIASALLILNILALVFEWAKIKSLLIVIIGRGIQFKLTKVETAINIVAIALVGYVASEPLIKYRNQRNALTGDWPSQQPVEWLLEKEESADSTLASRDLKVYFGAYGKYDESGASSYTHAAYTIDTIKHTITLKYDGGNVVNCKYEMFSDGKLKIDRLADSSKNIAVSQYFTRRIINSNRDE